MDVGAIFLLFLLLLLVILFVISPFRQPRRAQPNGTGQELSTLLAERDRILKEIQELDFDHSLGKIPADEYPVQRRALLQTGADVLRKIDGLSRKNPLTADVKKELPEVMVEGSSDVAVDPFKDEDLEILIAQRRASRKEKTGGFCPKCGKPFMQSDQFCSCCGQPLGVHP